VNPQPTAPAPSHLEPVRPPDNPAPGKLNLQLPQSSPGRALQSQLQDAIRKGGGGTYSSGGIGPGGGGGGRGGPSVGNNVTILTPTEGVDFNSYINRLLALVKRNWYAVMPESAYMGDKGVVAITFHINRDGTVPAPDPTLERTSGKQPLDAAAMSSIRTSSPFEPLPQEFKGPYIELRFIYFYNTPINSAE
jgi:TonB family protein